MDIKVTSVIHSKDLEKKLEGNNVKIINRIYRTDIIDRILKATRERSLS